jgi:hypothetical protein
MTYIYWTGGLLLIAVLVAISMYAYHRRCVGKATEAIAQIQLTDVAPLANECVEVFAGKLGVHLDVANWEDSSHKLDDACRSVFKLMQAFPQKELVWYFVKPLGAYLGELLRTHARHEWIKEEGRPPTMKALLKDVESTVSPFDKVIKHAAIGSPGDLHAYVAFAVIAARSAERTSPD